MAANSGAKTCHFTLSGTTVDTVALTDPVQQVAVINHHATEILSVLVGTSLVSSAAAVTNAGTVTASVDESFYVAPVNGRTVVFKSKRLTYVGLSVIGNGNVVSVHGTPWWD